MKSIAFIESNFTGIDAIKSASAAGIKCYLVTSDFKKLMSMLPHDLFENFDGVCELVMVRNSDDPKEVTDALKNLSLSAVMTFSQFRLITAAKVAAALGLMHTDPLAISTAIDKFGLREVLKTAGEPSIKYMSLSATCDVKQIIKEVGLPCILKPSRGHSSLGIKLIKTEQELLTAVVNHSSAHTNEEMIVEEYLEGPLFSLETMTTGEGQHFAWGYTDRVLTRDFIEMGGTFPAKPPDEKSGIELVFGALNAIGFNFGHCHTEMIFTKTGPKIVEINPRIGGSGIGRLVKRATECDVMLEAAQMFLGENVKTSWAHARSVTMRSLLPEISGRITHLPSKEEILSLPGVKDVWFQRQVGDMTDDTRSNFSIILTVLTESVNSKNSVETAEAAAQWCASKIKIIPVTNKMAVANE